MDAKELKQPFEVIVEQLETLSDAEQERVLRAVTAFLFNQKSEAAARLQAWVRDFGDQKQPEFVADLKTVLGMK